jgi:GntR family transcriptional regulator / MocR family aminotransferase
VLLWHQRFDSSRTILKRARSVPLPPLTLDRRRPLAGQIAAGVRIAIQTGRLRPGDRLPSSRTLARALGISRQIIVAAYEELTATGHVVGRTGDGSYVDRARRVHIAPAPLPARHALADPDGHAIQLWPLP